MFTQFAVFLLVHFVAASYDDRYDMSKLPFDLRPIRGFIGLWEIISRTDSSNELPPPDLIDIAINPLPKFGARAANITHTYFNHNKEVIRSDYGFMPIKNATRRDPRIHIAYLTTSSEGYSQMEQGQVRGNNISFHLKQFLRRSFAVGNGIEDLEIREFERQMELPDPNHLKMKVRAQTANGVESYIAIYQKISP
ncbi:hypothetical protein AB6A40_004566 [Gnathostoma spinigerum]|uniref:THAP4-like heme-binding domain-containing protein n=1 Tax=Gnathostoma spinigerum TaxID=75299 RepID=A0ABD6EMR5_9BILA